MDTSAMDSSIYLGLFLLSSAAFFAGWFLCKITSITKKKLQKEIKILKEKLFREKEANRRFENNEEEISVSGGELSYQGDKLEDFDIVKK